MNTLEYIELSNTDQIEKLINKIDKLSWDERIDLRNELEKQGCTKLVRNLYYDYNSQRWIE